MPQQTNLNVNPYYDDFDPDKDYYRVLFKPGFPIQARELTTLQSILQNQIESFGSHIFKEGSIVIPGNVVYDDQFYAVEIDATHQGGDVSLYIDNFVGKRIVGQESNVTAQVLHVISQNESERGNITLYVKFIDSGNTNTFASFTDGENLETLEAVDYGTTTIPVGNTFATCIAENANSIGAAAHIGDGIMFLRGTFVRVSKQTLLLEQYSNTPSYRVGLVINETISTIKDDASLYDNAKGFSNYTAPGADRLQIELVLGKKSVSDTTDVNFIELLRLENGKIRKIIKNTDYNIIRDYLAKRTFDESGDYSVRDFELDIFNSLNDRLGNNGLYFANQSTFEGNTPTDDLACLKVGPGLAYVKGFDVEKNGTTIIDVNKPRETKEVKTSAVDFEMGNLVKINHVTGVPQFKSSVQLFDRRRAGGGGGQGNQIGEARVYAVKAETAVGIVTASSTFDCYLYDVQTYTRLNVNSNLSGAELPESSYIKGLSSGATGYATTVGTGSSQMYLRQTSGSFIQGESISINGISITPRTVTTVKEYGASDVRMVFQDTSAVAGFNTDFQADTSLDFRVPVNFSVADTLTISNTGATTSAGNNFANFKVGDIVRYQKQSSTVPTFNRVATVAADGLSMTLAAVASVNGVCDGTLPSGTIEVQFTTGKSRIQNEGEGHLYAQLDDGNIATVDFEGSDLKAVVQITGKTTNGSGVMTLSASDVTGLTDVLFEAFDEERYSVVYSNGNIEPLRESQVSISSNVVTISGLRNSQSNVAVTATIRKTAIQNKQKVYNRVSSAEITRSKYSSSGSNANTSINDGLTQSNFFGLRVQDKEICLNVPDVANVFAVYQSIDENAVTLDTATFFTNADINDSVILGENLIGNDSGTIAKVVTKAANQITFVYLNQNRFRTQENVRFQESNVFAQISAITPGRYSDITNRFNLDKGQKDQYYDYSRLVRKDGYPEPSRRITVIHDNYTVPSNDEGDIFTVGSYDGERFGMDVPNIGPNLVRASDTLDFRPRVATFDPGTATRSPFDFNSRSFASQPKLLLAANESSIIGYTFYAPRIDRLYLNKTGQFVYVEGVPDRTPKAPEKDGDSMLIANISMPAYLYNTETVRISSVDNRRYTMRDIGNLEDRIDALEEVTALNLLEVETQSLQVQDATGLNRFKSGFFVDNFATTDFIDDRTVMLPEDGILRPFRDATTLTGLLSPKTSVPDNELDLAVDYDLLDSNVKKTGNVVTLDYTEKQYISQPHATKVENVNPFDVVLYNGSVSLNPQSDFWVVNRWAGGITLNAAAGGRQGGFGFVRTVSNVADRFMRSRNVHFFSVGLKPYTRYYQFLDGNGEVDVVPKLLEVENVTSVFEVGETVVGSIDGTDLCSFRIARPDHKEGPFATPTTSYTINPYDNTTTLPTSYSVASTVLNVDTRAMAAEAQGAYSGRVEVGMRLRGLNSGAQADVSDVRLVSDNGGDLLGCFFIRNPNASPAPDVRITTGTKEYKLTNSPTNAEPLPGSKLISTAETNYTANGRIITRQSVRVNFVDPLAQSFLVEDEGAFITSVDVFFGNKDPGNIPVEVQIRTMELGTPTTTLVSPDARVLVKPSEITTSRDGTVATNIKFPSPIYLEPNLEYALVLLADTDQYEVWIAEMGQKTVNASQLPAATGVVYSAQYSLGSLFKSQNGSIWNASQYEDMTFKLYRASFSSTAGTAYFYNPKLDTSNSGTRILDEDPIETYPKKLTVGIETFANGHTGITTLAIGRKVTSASKGYTYGFVEQQGGPAAVGGCGVMTGGSAYGTPSNPVGTYNITGNGTGLTLNVTQASGSVTAVSVASSGSGYVPGDTVGILTAGMGNAGSGAVINVESLWGIDTLYLTNVQGEGFSVGAGLSYFDSGTPVASNNEVTSSAITGGSINDGTWFSVNHYNHGMYADNNKVELAKIKPNTPFNLLSGNLGVDDNIISLASTTGLDTFEGLAVGAANTGYLVVNDEIISYDQVGVGSISVLARGVDSSLTIAHQTNDRAQKYELNGVSLRRVNKTHDMGSLDRTIDQYYLQIDRSNRNTDDNASAEPQLSFNTNALVGGAQIEASQNVQFNYIAPNFSLVTPGETSATATIRTVSGTSVNGTEVSFLDQGYEAIGINTVNELRTPRLIASKVNEDARTTSLPRNKSFTMGVEFSSNTEYLSPIIHLDTTQLELYSNRIDNPTMDYPNDARVKSNEDDPHSAIYISERVNLRQPATALRVLLTAVRPAASDFRVLYKLIRADSSEIDQSYSMFPGYENLRDNDGDGFGDEVIDPTKNNGHSDILVPPSLTTEDYLEYQFTADNLEQFTGYVIKVVATTTNQSDIPTFQDIRTLAFA